MSDKVAEGGSMSYCPRCGKAYVGRPNFCIDCGLQLAPGGQPSTASQPATPGSQSAERVSNWWWLVPILLTWIGGIIAYFAVRKRDSDKARNMLIAGIVLAFVVFMVGVASAFLLLQV